MQNLSMLSSRHKLSCTPLSLEFVHSMYYNGDSSHSESERSSPSISATPWYANTKMDEENTHEGNIDNYNRNRYDHDEEDLDEDSEILSVGCESPPPLKSSKLCKKVCRTDNHQILKFSIDNILRPEFGEYKPNGKQHTSSADVLLVNGKTTTSILEDTNGRYATKEDCSPIDLSKECNDDNKEEKTIGSSKDGSTLWPAWVYCTRYSDRPSSGPRIRRLKRKDKKPEEKRPRTAFSGDQLNRLKREFTESRYLTEKRRQELATELGLNEAQIKIWFQNKRAKIKKASGTKNPLALQLMAQGLYNHSTVPLLKEHEELSNSQNMNDVD